MVCIQRINDNLSIAKLEDLERNHNITLPKDYRDFLLEYNGGYPSPCIYNISTEQGESILNIFYGIGGIDYDLEYNFDILDEILEIGFIPIADDPGGNQICIGINKEYYGQIFHWVHDEEHNEMESMYFLSNNFNEFLESLY